MSLSTVDKILAWIAQKQLICLQNSYQQTTNTKLPIIVVVGTVGKSSITLLINQMLVNNGYNVISGTSEGKNLNTLGGLVMSLANFYPQLSGNYRILNWIKLLGIGLLTALNPRISFDKSAIIVAEIGFDYQGEAKVFEKIFGDIDVVVVSASTWEHNQGFDSTVDNDRVNQLKEFLPDYWSNTLSNGLIDPQLRNIAIEQLWLGKNAQYLVLPDKIGEISNTIITNIPNNEQYLERIQSTPVIETLTNTPKFYTATVEAQRLNGILCSDKLIYNSKYLLPKSFARTSAILQCVANVLELEQESISSTLVNCSLPFGRFGYFNGVNNTKIVDSTYNSDPASLGYFLDTLEEVINSPDEFGSPVGHTLILGEMRELGDTAKAEHTKILDRIIELQTKYSTQILNVYLLGQEWSKCGQAISGAGLVNYNNQSWKVYSTAFNICNLIVKNELVENSWFWIKGSQNTIFLEIVVEYLLADSKDTKYLCRQDPKWYQIKMDLKYK